MVVPLGMTSPQTVPLLNVGQFHSKHSSLDCIHAGVPAEFIMKITLRTAVISQTAHVSGEVFVPCGSQSRIAVGAQILCGVETERGGDSQRTGALFAPCGSDGLRGIFNQRKLELVRE